MRIGFGIMGGFTRRSPRAVCRRHRGLRARYSQALEAGRFTKLSFSGCDVYAESLIPQAARSQLQASA